MISAFVNPSSLRPVRTRSSAADRCDPVIVFRATPLRSLGMKCQSNRSSPSKGNRTAASCSSFRLSRNFSAAVDIADAGSACC